MGTLANVELAEWRKRAHTTFDPLYKSGLMTRSGAYRWLAKELKIRPADCHIAVFEIEDCRKAIGAIEASREMLIADAEGGGDG